MIHTTRGLPLWRNDEQIISCGIYQMQFLSLAVGNVMFNKSRQPTNKMLTTISIALYNQSIPMVTKFFLISVLFFIFQTSFSQTSKETTVKKIKAFLEQNSVAPGKNVPPKEVTVYFNKADKIIDIDGFQLPLQEVKTAYYLIQSTKHGVSFDCKGTNCITDPKGKAIDWFAIAFFSKQNCYDFIDLVSQLKQ
jgi:hypothetical protein